MFFVFGSPRSGTTLLATALGQHSAIVIPDETDVLLPLAFVFDRVTDPEIGRSLLRQLIPATARFAPSLGEYLTPRDVADIVDRSPYEARGLVNELYACVARRSGARLAGDKSPNDLAFARMLVKTGIVGPGVKVIHLVRDVRAVLLSLRTTGWLAEPERTFPRIWASSNLYLHAVCTPNRDDYLFLRYEDLVADPRGVITEILAFLGLSFEAATLDRHGRGRRHRGLAHHANLEQPVLPERADAWRTVIGDDLKRECERQAREALERFGYELG
jgi:hypothetical protein